MKLKYILYTGALATSLAVFTRCNKTPEVTEYAPYPETALEQNAGTWKTFVLANADEIPVPAPETAQSQAYLAEITSLKSAMSNATAEQKEAVNYWGGNGVLRWHEIARALAADYNAPPAYNADGLRFLHIFTNR